MLILRIIGLLAALAVGVCVLLWLFTGERKWLKYAWNLFRAVLFAVVLMLLLLFGERLLVL